MTKYKKLIAQNRKASFNYFIEERLEVGIVLKGSEVKALREGKVGIEDSHAADYKGEIFLYNCHIAEYDKANIFNHDTRRPRKLLLHSKEIKKIIGKIRLKGYTLIALEMYFNERNTAKVQIGIGKGKKLYDKRHSIKEREWNRQQSRLYSTRG